MSEKKLPSDADLAGVESALRRAAKSAKALARRTKTPCYVVRDGKVVDIAEKQKPATSSKQSAN